MSLRWIESDSTTSCCPSHPSPEAAPTPSADASGFLIRRQRLAGGLPPLILQQGGGSKGWCRGCSWIWRQVNDPLLELQSVELELPETTRVSSFQAEAADRPEDRAQLQRGAGRQVKAEHPRIVEAEEEDLARLVLDLQELAEVTLQLLKDRPRSHEDPPALSPPVPDQPPRQRRPPAQVDDIGRRAGKPRGKPALKKAAVVELRQPDEVINPLVARGVEEGVDLEVLRRLVGSPERPDDTIGVRVRNLLSPSGLEPSRSSHGRAQPAVHVSHRGAPDAAADTRTSAWAC